MVVVVIFILILFIKLWLVVSGYSLVDLVYLSGGVNIVIYFGIWDFDV